MQKQKIFLLLLTSLVLTSCARWKGGPERFYFGPYSEAEQFYNKGEYEKAIEKYQAYIQENPEGNLAVISQYYIAKSQSALGRNDEAKNNYNEIIQKYPNLVWAKFAETQLKELDGQAAGAKPAA
jgi:outer membrane protein assembly factor BamD (BamD/ComL family)